MDSSTSMLELDAGGTKISILKHFFKKHPRSLFYELAFDASYDKCPQHLSHIVKLGPGHFFVQRSPELIQVMVQYVINNKLHVPKGICVELVSEEFKFWRLDLNVTCESCADNFIGTQDCEEATKEAETETKPTTNWLAFKAKLWLLVEYPHSSLPALGFMSVSTFFIILSVVVIVLSSMPELQGCPTPETENNTAISADTEKDVVSNSTNTNLTNIQAAIFVAENNFIVTDCTGTTAFHIIDFTCIAWFTLELILRIMSTPDLKRFFTAPMSLVDMMSVMPFYFELIFWISSAENTSFRKARSILLVLRMLRVIRVFRILKLARYSPSLKILGNTIYSARQELSMLLTFLTIAMFVASNFMYQAEKDEPDSLYTSVPATFWWCIVTLTTVGYGDIFPKTVLGKIFAGITCVGGVLITAFPIAILVEKFMTEYKKLMKLYLIEQTTREKKTITKKTFQKFGQSGKIIVET